MDELLVLLGALVVGVPLAAYTFGFWYRGRVEKHLTPIAEARAQPQDSPTADDPLAQNSPSRGLEASIRTMIAQQVALTFRSRSGVDIFEGAADQQLAMELIARGWVAYKPADRLDKV